MKTNKASNILRIVGIVMIISSIPILCIMLLQILQGSLTTFDAARIAYGSEDPAVLAYVRNTNIIHELSFIAGFSLMFISGLLGVKYAKRAEKIKWSLVFSVLSLLTVAGACVFYKTVFTSMMNSYDIYPDAAIEIIIIFLAIPLVHTVVALMTKRSLEKNISHLTIKCRR